MKAAVLHAFDGPLEVEQIDRPSTGAGEVLVRVAASGVNPLDVKIRMGQGAHAKPVVPAVLGLDLAGWVEEVGGGRHGLRVGGRGRRHPGLAGGVRRCRCAAHRPKATGLQHARGGGCSAGFHHSVGGPCRSAGVKAGDTVLVHGGGGGVGQMAIQIALSYGADVFATDSAVNLRRITRLDATAIDYATESVDEYVAQYTDDAGFDVIFDGAGGATIDASFAAVKRYMGHVVSALGWGTHGLAPLSFRGATYSGIFTLQPMLTGEGLEHHVRSSARQPRWPTPAG